MAAGYRGRERNVRINWLPIGVIVLMAGLVAVACGSGGDSKPDPTAGTAVQPPADNADNEVNVRMFEWTVDVDVESVAAGAITFNAANIGGAPHDLLVIRSDLAIDALPVISGGAVNEASSLIAVVGKIDVFDPGFARSAVFDLEPGVYALVCNTVDETDTGPRSHYQEGMWVELIVTE